MASSDYDTLSKEIYGQIYQRLERKEDDRLRFAPTGTAEVVLHQGNLKLIYQCLASSTSLTRDNALTEELFVQRVEERRLQRFLAILIFASCSLDALATITARLVASDGWLVRKNEERLIFSLPADLEQLKSLFEDNVNADKFYSKQACFCTVVLRDREEVIIQHPNLCRLPYLVEQPLAEGSFGKVFKVRIATGHFVNHRMGAASTVNNKPMDIARKDYVITTEFRVQKEREIMETILSSSSQSENILESYGGLEISPTTYCLFMPLAICDLRAYMMENHTTAPNTDEAKANYVRCAEGLAEGLSFLHQGIKTPELDELVCYHMDLKPDNILLFQEKDRWIWKISDFGMSCVKKKRKTNNQHTEAEKDFNRWFVRRRKPEREPSVDPTRNNRGEGTYLAPESMSKDAKMTVSSDVWSLGCVISVLFAYLDDGRNGVLNYQTLRMQNRKADGYDRFFIPDPNFHPNSVHPAIRMQHDRLIKNASFRGRREAKAVAFMLKKLEDSVLRIEQDKRASAEGVKKLLAETYQLLKQPEAEDDATNPSRAPHTGLRERVGSVLHKLGPGKRKETLLTRYVKAWQQTTTENFKGCVISPDATLVAYWTDLEIVLYTSQSLSPRTPDKITPGSRERLQSPNCIWKSVALTREYLIASTTGSNFQCYVFELEGGTSVEANLDDRFRISLPSLPEIHKLTITPDTEKLVCILRNQDDERLPGSVFHVPISALKKFGLRKDSLTPVPSPDPWQLIHLKWPAADVTHLPLPIQDTIYMAIQPELTIKSRDHKVPVVALSLQTRDMAILEVEAKDLGTSTMNTVGLFTTFAPFPPMTASGLGRRCAIVTREKRLLIADLDEDEESGAMAHDIQRDVPGYRVLSLMIPQGHRSDDNNKSNINGGHHHYHHYNSESEGTAITNTSSSGGNNYNNHHRHRHRNHNRNHNKIYALAAPNASHRVVLLEMRVPLPPPPPPPPSSSSFYPTTYGRNVAGVASAGGPVLSDGSGSSGEVAIREIAQLEGLGYDDEFTEQLCEHEEDNDNDDDGGGGGGGGYVLVAALVGANRKAIYRVPLALPAGAGGSGSGRESAGAVADGRGVQPAGDRDWSSAVLAK